MVAALYRHSAREVDMLRKAAVSLLSTQTTSRSCWSQSFVAAAPTSSSQRMWQTHCQPRRSYMHDLGYFRASKEIRRFSTVGQEVNDYDNELAEKMINKEGGLLLDVRSQQEFNMGSAHGAVHIPYDRLQARMQDILDFTDGKMDHPIVVFCASGARSQYAKALLMSEGFTYVTNLGLLNLTLQTFPPK